MPLQLPALTRVSLDVLFQLCDGFHGLPCSVVQPGQHLGHLTIARPNLAHLGTESHEKHACLCTEVV